MNQEAGKISRGRWALITLLIFLIGVCLLSLVSIPVQSKDGSIKWETLTSHPDKIFTIYGDMILEASFDPGYMTMFLLFLVPLIAWPGALLYSFYRAIAWPHSLTGHKAWLIAIGIYLLLLAGLSTWSTIHNPLPQGTPAPTSMDWVRKKSKDLESDLQAMWGVEEPTPDQDWVTATDEAIQAAARVFNTLDLVGMPLEEAKATLKLDLRAQHYGYKAPFFQAPDNSFTLRFDNGAWGLQYDLITNDQGVIIEVQRTWIH